MDNGMVKVVVGDQVVKHNIPEHHKQEALEALEHQQL